MNKRYIDFVPTKGAEGKNSKTQSAAPKVAVVSDVRMNNTRISNVGASSRTSSARVSSARMADAGVSRTRVERTAVRDTRASKPVQAKKTAVVYRSMPEIPQVEPRRVKRGLKMNDDDMQLGVIEDLNTRFVASEIEKRPLGGERPAKKDDIKEVKSRRLLGRRQKKASAASVEKPVENLGVISSAQAVSNADKATFKTPKSPFINQEKVIKRPLSKNAYQKRVEVPAEEPSGPVAIIEKPAKDKNVSLVVTIIITIILGAAAGTVAFLLLPK